MGKVVNKMGTIIEKKRKGGSRCFSAQILIMRDRTIVHRESKTFDRRPAASAWLKKREAELAKPDAVLGRKQGASGATLSDAIDRYITGSRREMGRTKAQVLASIKQFDIADRQCGQIRSQDIVDFATELGANRKPQTVANYLSHLAAVFAVARPAWGYDLDPGAMADASKVARRLGLISKSSSRERRPTIDELDRLLAYFEDRRRRRSAVNPMCAIVVFALFSTRRLEEITRIRWADLDTDGARVLVRDMKNPGEKVGNNIWCDLPEPARRIIVGMPKVQDEIFPFGADAISAAFTRACKLLGIIDLHFHDLRHEGISRLFEIGLNIPHVAAVSGHRSWQSLQRYTHLRQVGDKFAKWEWINRAADGAAREP